MLLKHKINKRFFIFFGLMQFHNWLYLYKKRVSYTIRNKNEICFVVVWFSNVLSKIVSCWKAYKLSKSSYKMESTIWDMCLHLRLYFTFLLRREATKLRIISTSKLRDCAGMLVTHVFSSHCEGWLSKLLFVFGLDCWATMVLCLCACVCIHVFMEY